MLGCLRSCQKKNYSFDHHLHEIFGLHSGTDYWTGPNFPNTSAATTLYTPPPPPSPCHPRCPYVPLPVSPLAAASTCSTTLVRGLHARATRSPGPSGRTLLSHVSRLHPHLSHGPTCHPSAPPMSQPRPCPHLQPCPASWPPSRAPSPPGPHPQLCPTSQPLSRAPSPPGPHPQPCDAIT